MIHRSFRLRDYPSAQIPSDRLTLYKLGIRIWLKQPVTTQRTDKVIEHPELLFACKVLDLEAKKSECEVERGVVVHLFLGLGAALVFGVGGWGGWCTWQHWTLSANQAEGRGFPEQTFTLAA